MREKALLEGGSAALNEELENLKKEYERRLQISEHRYTQAMEKLSELDGGFAAEQLRHEKELEPLCQYNFLIQISLSLTLF